MSRSPMSPVPNHDDGIAGADRRDGRGVGGDGGRFRERCLDEIESLGHGVDDPLRHDHIFGEGARAAVFGAGDAEDPAVVAEIDIAPAAVKAFAAVFGRIERYAVSGPEARDALADGGDFSRGLMAHDDRRPAPSGGAVHPVDVGAADRGGPDPHEDVGFVPQDGVGNVLVDEFTVFFENEGFHAGLRLCVLPASICGQAAVHGKGYPVQKRRFIGSKIERGTCHILNRGEPAERNFPEALFLLPGVFE